MPEILVTPQDAEVMAFWERGIPVLQFPALSDLVCVPSSEARVSAKEGIWSKKLFPNVRKWLGSDSSRLNLAADGQIRFGNSAVTVSNDGKVLLGFFDSTHPVRPYMASPAAGIFEEIAELPRNPLMDSLDELSFEIIPGHETIAGCWSYNGLALNQQHVIEYAQTHQLEFDPNLTFEVKPYENDFYGRTIIRFGDDFEASCLIAWEEETGGCELEFPWLTTMVNAWDGEKIPNGQWRDSHVKWVSSIRELPLWLYTTKALAAVTAFCM